MNSPKKTFFLALLIQLCTLNAQGGIGTDSPNPNAVLDVYSHSQGVKFPSMSTSQRMAISLPAEGLVVFDKNLDCLMINRGAKIHDWECLGTGQEADFIGGTENDWDQLFLDWNTTQDNGGVGVVRSIRIKPDNPSSVLIGAATAGIWQTTDSGETYRLASADTPEVEWVNEIVYSRQNPQIVYAGTDIGVVKSINGGLTWDYTGLRMHKPSKYGNLVWVDVPDTDSNIVYATTEEPGNYKLHKSTDGGVTWVEMYRTANRIWEMRVKLNDPNTVYILEESAWTSWINFRKSTDSGNTFITINNGFPSNHNIETTRARLATTPANKEVVYIAIGYDEPEKHTGDKIAFYKSSDGGTSFVKKCCGNPNVKLESSYGTTDFLTEFSHLFQLFLNFGFTVSETDENFLASAAQKIKVSIDGGESWSFDLSGTVTTENQYNIYPTNNAKTGIHVDHHAFSIIGNHIWNGNDGGVYYSSDGGMTIVKDKSDGLGIQELWGFSQSFKNDIMAVGLNHNKTIFRDDAVYGGWIAIRGADAMSANVNPIEDQYTYVHPYYDERVTRSLTSKTGHIIEPLGISLGYVTRDNVEFDPHNYFTFYSSSFGDRNVGINKLMKTTDNAGSWTEILDLGDSDNAVSIKVSFANSNYVYAVLEPNNVNVAKPNRVIKSIDAGKTWTDIAPPTALTNDNDLWRLAVSDKNPEHLWVTTAQNNNTPKIFHSTDGGTTWNDFSAGLPGQAIYSLIYQRGSDDLLYVGTTFGVYYRKNGMAQWELFGKGLPACKASFMFINYAKGKLRLGTSRGLYEIDLFEQTPPKANITANRASITPDDYVVKFADYSVADKDATYFWEFPGGIPPTSTEERPVVSFDPTLQSSFDVTLTVSDKRGMSTQTLVDFIVLPPTVESYSSQQNNNMNEAIYAIDGLKDTFWHTSWTPTNPSHPHELVIDLGGLRNITGITYLPRQTGGENGLIADFEIYVSEDTSNWGDPVASGTWTKSLDLKTVNFVTSKVGRFYKLKALSGFDNKEWAAVAEIEAITGNLEIQYPRVYDFDSQQTEVEKAVAVNAIDGDNETYWHTEWNGDTDQLPHWIVIDLGETKTITGLNYLSRQNPPNHTISGLDNGRIANYEIYVSDDPNNWGTAVDSGTWTNAEGMKTANFTAKSGRYYKLVALSEVHGQKFTNAAEISVITE